MVIGCAKDAFAIAPGGVGYHERGLPRKDRYVTGDLPTFHTGKTNGCPKGFRFPQFVPGTPTLEIAKRSYKAMLILFCGIPEYCKIKRLTCLDRKSQIYRHVFKSLAVD